MSESVKLLKGIMKTSGWTQEQVAEKLGVSFQTMNAWVNGKAKPRVAMRDKIRRLYLAQDVTKDIEPTYITLVNVPRWVRIDDIVLLEKEYDNDYDDEAITATVIDDNGSDEDLIYDKENSAGADELDEEEINIDDEDDITDEEDEVGEIRIFGEFKCGDMRPDSIYVANSINTVIRGTSSAGRIYDKFTSKARARILFIFHKTAIARVVEWNYEEKG